MVRLDSANHELTGVDANNWDAAIWNPPFTSPVEVWATIKRAGINDAALYANVIGGGSGTVHDSSGYFVDFGGTASGGSPARCPCGGSTGPKPKSSSRLRRHRPQNYTPGTRSGCRTAATGVLVAWYKPSGGSWSAVVSAQDSTYTSGNIALEAIPGTAYGFSNFGGGSPAVPVQSAITTTTSIAPSAAGVTAGQPVTYTATVSPAPDGGTVSFADNGVAIPDCGARPVNGSGTATCTVDLHSCGKTRRHRRVHRIFRWEVRRFHERSRRNRGGHRSRCPARPNVPTARSRHRARRWLPRTRACRCRTRRRRPAPRSLHRERQPGSRRGYGLIHRRWCGYPRLHRPTGDERILDLQLHVSGFRDRPAPRRVHRRRPLRGF